MRVRVVLVIAPLVFALFVAPAVGLTGPAADAQQGQADRTAAESPLVQEDNETERPLGQTLQINLTPEGHAEWTVTTAFHLEDEDDREAFRAFAEDVESGNADVGYSATTFERFADEAGTAVDREMEIRGANWSNEVKNDTAYLRLEFTWTNFAEVDDNRIQLGDVFSTETGTWLSTLDESQQLVIAAPPGYAVDSFSLRTPPDDGEFEATAQWTGPVTFEPGDIQITYVATNSGPPRPIIPSGSLLLVGGSLLAAVALLAAGGYLLVRRVRDGDGIGDATAEMRQSAKDALYDTDDETRDGSAGAATGAARGSDASDDAADDEGIDPALLSDEERVERLLHQNGGRMKQANIVKETGWSNAKVSQLLSTMDEEEQIDKLRIGRENLITLPDEDVTDLK